MGRSASSSDLRKARSQYGAAVETVTGVSGSTVAASVGVVVSECTAAGAGDNTISLADGEVPGQRKVFILTVQASTGDIVITPTTLCGGTTITLDAQEKGCELVWTSIGWLVVGNTGTLA